MGYHDHLEAEVTPSPTPSGAKPLTDEEMVRIRGRVEEGWEYHSDLGLTITPHSCESGLNVAEARRLFATIDALRRERDALLGVEQAARVIYSDGYSPKRMTELRKALAALDAARQP